MMDHTQIIEDTLRQLGVGGNYIAQQRAVTAIQLAIEDEDRLLYVTKNIYLPVAQICGCKWTAVERNLRTVVQRVWRINPEGLAQMAGLPPERASHCLRLHRNSGPLHPPESPNSDSFLGSARRIIYPLFWQPVLR